MESDKQERGVAVRNRIYMEITNRCNLACDFCHGTKRPLGAMTPENFRRIAEKLRGQTNYLYFHVLGEPLLHPQLGEPLDLSVVDVSFISLKLVLPVIKTLLKPTGQVLCLIKPQFEAGKEKVGKKGVVREKSTHKEVLDNFVALADELQFKILGLTFSPVKGPEGNIEFLGHLTLDNVAGIRPDTALVAELAHQTLDKGENS